MVSNIKLVRVLTKLGLKDKEALVYIACLEFGSFISASQLARKTSINRVSIYSIAKQLAKKALLRSSKINDKICYYARPINIILQELQKQKEKIDAQCKLLTKTATFFNNIDNQETIKKQMIDYFFGYDSIKDFYKKLPWEGIHYSIFSPESITKIFGNNIFWGTGSINKLRSLQGKEIISRTEHCSYYDNLENNKKIPHLQCAEVNNGLLLTDTIIFPDKFVVIINLDENNLHGVKINCQTLISSYMRIFESMWKNAKIIK